MKTLFTIDLKNYKDNWQRSRRDSARAIIHMGSDKLALVYATKLGYYKFPGGGIKENEDKVEALIREVQEEVGLVVIPQTVKEYGVVHRYQKSGKTPDTIFEQDNFYYECQVEDKKINQTLDDYEDEAGFELRIVSIKEALEANLKYRDTNDFNIAMIARDTRTLAMMLGVPVEPSRCMAELLFNEGVAKNPGLWREHSLAVARAAEKIALAVNQNCGQEKLDPDKAYIYGLLHDIGRQQGYTYIAHVYDGYHFLMSLGYENAARICLTHSFNLQTTEDYIGKIDITPEQMEEIKTLLADVKYDDYDRLIQLLDSTCGADGTQNLEQRMGDVKARYGYYPQPKWDKNFELKAYFEKLAGRDLYEIIRRKGLILEGGAMRGMFTSGVLDVFLENGITFDGAIGVSAGATFGCNFKSRQPGRAIRYNKRFARDWRYCSIRSLILTGDMYGARFCYDTLPNKLDIFDRKTYQENPMEFYCVASDCKTGKPVYKMLQTCDQNELTWMRASASMPLVSRVVSLDGYKLLDGGMTDSIPLKYFESIGYNRNVVILTQPREYRKKPASLMWLMKIMLHKYPLLVEAMRKRPDTYNEETTYVFEKADKGEVFVICPEKPLGISRTENNVDELQRVYDLGRQTATRLLPKIKEFLSKTE